MRIVLITPYLPGVRNGNAHTAVRWRRFLRRAGHRVDMALDWDGRPADLLIALHARRSHGPLARFALAHPDRPRVLMLTGTDLYRDIRSDADAQDSLARATHIVVLQDQGLAELAPDIRAKARVIHQSAPSLAAARRPVRHFDVCIASHLRDEKDPFRGALASRLLPAASRIRLIHVGGPLQEGMAEAARDLAGQCPRWRWLGARSHGETRRRIARAHLLLLSSPMEGGANVICEAVTSGTPVLASRVPGNVGMLGEDYPGYYPFGDTAALAALLERTERDGGFYAALRAACASRAPLFAPAREAALVAALAEDCRCA